MTKIVQHGVTQTNDPNSDYRKRLRNEAWEVFQRLDVNKTGEIKTADANKLSQQMRKAFSEMGINIKEEYFKGMLQDMDEGHSGAVSNLDCMRHRSIIFAIFIG